MMNKADTSCDQCRHCIKVVDGFASLKFKPTRPKIYIISLYSCQSENIEGTQ